MDKDLIFSWDLGCNCWKSDGLNTFFVYLHGYPLHVYQNKITSAYLASFEPKKMDKKHLHEVFKSMGDARDFFQEKYHCRLKFRDPSSKL